ncbi:MAG: argininosuccinate synthase [Firmicutes bacterium]|nr:argininosuccinate synthase [Bacillota bacterium]
MEKVRKVVLAYSGGLDTSIIIHWLRQNYGCQVVAFAADVGQFELAGKAVHTVSDLKRKAIVAGASKVYVQDLKGEFVRDYIFPTLKANAVYEGKYLLSAALSRPLIAKKLVEIAKREEADAVAHGCTGKGNDQVRFELTFKALDPELKILAPLREWEMVSRQEEIEYAKRYKIPVSTGKEKLYSIDRNLWGVCIECGPLEDPWKEPPEDVYQITTPPEKAPSKPVYLDIYFKQGIPTKMDGKLFSPVELIKKLNRIGGAHGIGRVDLVENRVVGIKSREIYEAPAATILYLAHRELESLTLDRDTFHYKELIASRYAELVYCGLWESALKKTIDAFVCATQEKVTGTVRVKLYKGNLWVVGRKSPYSFYQKRLATYGAEDKFDRTSARGFIDLLGLPLEVKALIDKEGK